jgi:uncharacterized protein (TIGR02145 family)
MQWINSKCDSITLAAGVLLALVFISSCSSNDAEYGSFEYGGQTYKTIEMGDLQWMAENLNLEVPGSKCYNDDPRNCEKYGRLYNWAAAMGLLSSCSNFSCANSINTPHRGICPKGWHIPTSEEWGTLYSFADSISRTDSLYDSNNIGKYLKAKEGWSNCGSLGSDETYSCEDSFGFSALPGGYGFDNAGFSDIGEKGFWWSASEHDEEVSYAYGSYIHHRNESDDWYYGLKTYFFSVRCLQD